VPEDRPAFGMASPYVFAVDSGIKKPYSQKPNRMTLNISLPSDFLKKKGAQKMSAFFSISSHGQIASVLMY
jgi:hypothetical protein